MILVDTSVWIEFFNHSNTKKANLLQKLVEETSDVCLTGIIMSEILQGIKQDSIFNEIKDYLLQFPIFMEQYPETYFNSAQIYRKCRKQGFTIRKTIDCLIAAIAIENNLMLFHCDKDFDIISKYISLKVFKNK